MKLRTILATLVVGVGLNAAPAMAQDGYPDGDVTIVVPFAAGGATDYFARLTADYLSRTLGANFVVENRAGGGGNIGSDMVAKSTPDGRTLLLGAAGNIGINPSIFADMPYDPTTDLVAVAPVAGSMNVLVVHPSIPAETVGELIEHAKSEEGGLNFASSGIGGTLHLSGELFKMQADVSMMHIPYQGSGPAMVDLLAGRVPIMFDNIPSSLPHIQDGKLRPLGVTGPDRSPALPDVPTIAETELPDFSVVTWFGLFAPAGTPEPIVEKLNTALTAMTGDPKIVEQIRARGSEPMSMTPADFQHLVRDDVAKWAKVVENADEPISR
ncbi:Bug family tripartite tricarboxylate transporter substrate binding protein [Stappia stellulata]|uniref:Bug family tripartite tricarboxylate transporter substrate binding protein n=1 Tax=Stappia stellulata TaxID=71235 RepID=UPI00041A99F5|nr:tripartite tricarboxylate transporter substrate binding protein [Stappia stellulata]